MGTRGGFRRRAGRAPRVQGPDAETDVSSASFRRRPVATHGRTAPGLDGSLAGSLEQLQEQMPGTRSRAAGAGRPRAGGARHVNRNVPVIGAHTPHSQRPTTESPPSWRGRPRVVLRPRPLQLTALLLRPPPRVLSVQPVAWGGTGSARRAAVDGARERLSSPPHGPRCAGAPRESRERGPATVRRTAGGQSA